MINKLFQPLYSDNESERYLVEVASMEHPIFDYGFPPDGPSDSMLKSAQQDYMIRCDEYDTHISQLKKYPAPWLTENMKEPMELGKDFELRYEQMCHNSLYGWEGISKEEYETTMYNRRIIAVPITTHKEFETMKFPGNNFNQPTYKQEQDEITNWIQSAKSNTGNENTSEENAWSWVVLFYSRLKELVELKRIKDSDGKTEDYSERQPVAWFEAKQIIELFDRDNNAPPKIAVPISGIEEGDLWENVIAIATTFEYDNSLSLLKSKYSISKL